MSHSPHRDFLVLGDDFGSRIYTQLNGEKARQLARDREVRHNASSLEDTRIDDHGITAGEVLEQTNKILAPYTVEMISSISWFVVWKGKLVLSYI